MVRVQSVTWAAIAGCPCDWWLVLCCLVVTLTFDSSPIKGEGELVGCFGLLSPHPVDTALKPV